MARSTSVRAGSVRDCDLLLRRIKREPASGVQNLFTRTSALGDRHRAVCEEVGEVMLRRHGLDGVRETLVALAAAALLLVDDIDACGGHVGAVLLPPDSQAS